MVKVMIRTHDDARIDELEVSPGTTLMIAAVRAGAPGIDADCGGSMVCGTCHVYVDEGWLDRLPTQSAMERDLLEFSPNAAPNSRLACQIVLGPEHDGMGVRTPESQL